MGIINLLREKEVSIDTSKKEDESKDESLDHDSEATINGVDKKEGSTEAKDAKHIVLSGPLSQMYTTALNMVYANEDVASQIFMGGTIKKIEDKSMVDSAGMLEEDTADEPDDHDLYVYCCDSDMEQTDLVNVVDSLSKAVTEGYKDIVLAIECDVRVSPKISLIEELSRKLGVKVCYSRKSALESIQQIYERG